MKKKVIVHLISSLKMGGAESWLIDVINHIPAQEFEQYVIYFHHGPNQQQIAELGIPTYKISGLISLYDPLFWWRLYKLLKNLEPDLIHSSLWAANFTGRIIAYILNIPIVCSIHLGANLDGTIRNILDRFTLRLATQVVPVSQQVAESLYERPYWINKTKITVIKNGIDIHRIQKTKEKYAVSRESLRFNADTVVIGSVGRFIPRKNFHMLLEAFALVHQELPNTQLLLIGFGPQEQELRRKTHMLNIAHAVTFIVAQPAYGYYAAMDCFILPSLQEGLSIALLEAMSCGLPCIVTHQEQHHDVIVSGTNGLLIYPAPEAIFNALKLMISQPTLRKQLGRQAYESIVKDFNINSMQASYLNLYQKLYR